MAACSGDALSPDTGTFTVEGDPGHVGWTERPRVAVREFPSVTRANGLVPNLRVSHQKRGGTKAFKMVTGDLRVVRTGD